MRETNEHMEDLSLIPGRNTETDDIRDHVKTLVSDIEGNGYWRNQKIIKRKQIREIVEPSLIKACEILYDKNIQTLESSANIVDVTQRGNASIIIDYNSLSEKNKEIVNNYFGGHRTSGDNIEITSIKVPLHLNTTTDEVKNKSVDLANKFQKQPLKWSETYTFKEVVKLITLEDDTTNYSPDDFTEYYYDKESKCFFLSKEHYEKLKEFK